MPMPAVISIVGKSNSGKTTLMEKLIPELKKRGYAVGVIKHAHHGFEMDLEGKDSWRHKKAGADTVMAASEHEITMIKSQTHASLDRLIRYFDDVDIVLTEGYKGEKKPKIEVFRSGQHKTPLVRKQGEWIAMVSDVHIDADIPVFGLEAIQQIADFIEVKFLSTADSKKQEIKDTIR
jgi:molybdopterin-guanine dinucleotide biosynthesis adapter protein